jgi:hypothetical protein
MTQAEIQHDLYEEIDKLNAAEQLRLLAVARDIRSEAPKGTPWSEIKHLVGTLPDADAREIMAAIDEGCENIDTNEW